MTYHDGQFQEGMIYQLSAQRSEQPLDGRHEKSRILSRNRMSRIVRHHEGAMRRCQDPFAQNPQSIT